MSRPRTGPAQSRARSNTSSKQISSDPLVDSPRFDDDADGLAEDPEIEQPHKSMDLAEINDQLWWTGLKVGIGNRSGRPSIIVVWEGPDIVKRFFEWKRE